MLQRKSQTSNFEPYLILRKYKLDSKAKFTEKNSINPKLRQDQIAKELRCSNGILKQYRQDIIMLLPYRIPSNGEKKKRKSLNQEPDLKRPQTISNDLKRPPMISKKSSPFFETVRPYTSQKKNEGWVFEQKS